MIAIQVFVQNRSHSEYKKKKMTWCHVNTADIAEHNIPPEEGLSRGAQYQAGGLHTPLLLSAPVLMPSH